MLTANPDAGSITCTGNAQNPHTSTHAPGTVNAVDTITCTSAVAELSGTMELYRGSTQVAFGSGSNYGKSFVQWNAAEPCHKATYHSDGYGYITFPPGYVPQYDSHHLVSNYVPITTC